MTPEQLEYICSSVYGERWDLMLARDTGVHPRTIERWRDGSVKIGQRIEATIRNAVAMRRSRAAADRAALNKAMQDAAVLGTGFTRTNEAGEVEHLDPATVLAP